MTTAQQAIVAAAFAMFALEQPVDLAEIAKGAKQLRLPMAASETPDWFAAAAEQDSSLHEMAPELLILPSDLDSADGVDVSGIDLIRVYAPELQGLEEMDEALPDEVPPEAPAPAEQPRTATQLGLLKELGNLES